MVPPGSAGFAIRPRAAGWQAMTTDNSSSTSFRANARTVTLIHRSAKILRDSSGKELAELAGAQRRSGIGKRGFPVIRRAPGFGKTLESTPECAAPFQFQVAYPLQTDASQTNAWQTHASVSWRWLGVLALLNSLDHEFRVRQRAQERQHQVRSR